MRGGEYMLGMTAIDYIRELVCSKELLARENERLKEENRKLLAALESLQAEMERTSGEVFSCPL